MTDSILLISTDPKLARRVQLALPATGSQELHCCATMCAAPDQRGWLLMLVDARAGDIDLSLRGRPAAPLIWLADPPLAPATPFGAGIIDCLDRGEKPSKLAFVLGQHIAAAQARRLRARPALYTQRPLESAEEQRALANLLTAILGNAELALGGSNRLPAPLRARLQRLCTLTGALRDLLTEAAAPTSPHSKISPTLNAA